MNYLYNCIWIHNSDCRILPDFVTVVYIGVFVKSQLGNKSTLSLLVISQPKNIGEKSTFKLLVSSQPNYIEVKI